MSKNKKSHFFARRAKEVINSQKEEILVTPNLEVEKLIEAAIQEPAVEPTPELKVEPIKFVEEKKLDKKKQLSYNVHYNTKYKKFMLVTIEFDLVTGFCQIVSTEPWADSWPVAIEKLRNKVALVLARGEDRV